MNRKPARVRTLGVVLAVAMVGGMAACGGGGGGGGGGGLPPVDPTPPPSTQYGAAAYSTNDNCEAVGLIGTGFSTASSAEQQIRGLCDTQARSLAAQSGATPTPCTAFAFSQCAAIAAGMNSSTEDCGSIGSRGSSTSSAGTAAQQACRNSLGAAVQCDVIAAGCADGAAPPVGVWRPGPVMPPPPSVDDHGDTRASATTLQVGGSVTGEIEVGDDVDVFRMDVTQAGTLTVFTTGSLDTFGDLEASGGGLLESDDDTGTDRNFQIVYAVTPGTYYINVSSFGTNTGSYRVAARLDVSPPPPPPGGVDHRQVGSEFGTTSTTGRTNLNLTCTNDVVFSDSGNIVLPSVDVVALPPEAGTVTLEYNAINVPDRFVVAVGGQSVIDTQYVGTSHSVAEVNAVLTRYGFTPTSQAAIISPGNGSRSFQKPAGVTSVVVRVYAPLTGTAWHVTLKFSGASCGPTTPAPTLPVEPPRTVPPQSGGSDLPGIQVAGAGTTTEVYALNNTARTVTFQAGTWFEPKDGRYQRMIIAENTSVRPGQVMEIPTACMQRSNPAPARGARFFSSPKSASGAVQQCQRNCLGGQAIQSCVWDCERASPPPGNQAPVAAPAQSHSGTVGGGWTWTRTQVESSFRDPDNDRLTYSAQSSNPSVASVSMPGGGLRIDRVGAGTATISVVARDPGGLTATWRIHVSVTGTAQYFGEVRWTILDCARGPVLGRADGHTSASAARTEAMRQCSSAAGQSCRGFVQYGSAYGGQRCYAVAHGSRPGGGCTANGEAGTTQNGAINSAVAACRADGLTGCTSITSGCGR